MNGATDFDVVIVGFGPVGQLLAGLLGAQGVRVGVFERWSTVYSLPRACVVDHEVMRILQADGIADDFEKVAVKIDGDYVWTNARGKVLLSLKHPVEGVSGWGSRYMMYQPDLESLLDQKACSLDSVSVNRGWVATDLKQDQHGVELSVEQGAVADGTRRTADAGQRQIRARYIVGADGANSFVRDCAQLGWVDLGFRADWIVIDFKPHDPDAVVDVPLTGQLCDPARPVSMFRRLGKKHMRWEMMLLPGETAEDITRPERIWELLSRWVTPADGVIVRRAVYTFKSGVADRWRAGRVMLAGDSAHLMPPFLGQGMCSGMRDAMGLAWRLLGLLRGQVTDAVLESYTEERRRHVEAVIARAVALGQIICITDPAQAAARDQQILGGKMPPLPAYPLLSHGLLHQQSGVGLSPHAGELALQSQVVHHRVQARFDEAVGRGWQIISMVADPDSVLSASQRDYLDRIGARRIHIRDVGGPEAVVEVGGRYRDWFASLDSAAVLVRPDFYIFGTAQSLHEMPALVEDLMIKMPLAN
jgi:2-polyprenyl-6-methoxyphenol hydroxylase-like FAD-dependent oxidoreductase